MTEWTVEDFAPGKRGPQMQWASDRLTVHGYPLDDPLKNLRDRIQKLQLDRGLTGTQLGGNADGWIGPTTLRWLKADPAAKYNIDTSLWKWTSPEWNEDETSPFEVYPIPAGYQMAPWLTRTALGSLMFAANAGGAHTPNSLKSRSEFREMSRDGSRAKWDSEDGRVHVLAGLLRIHELPPEVPSVVFGQYHDPYDDVFMLNAVGNTDRNYASLFLLQSLGPGKGSVKHLLNPSYRLGDLIDYRLEMGQGKFKCFYKGVVKEFAGEWEDVYRKAGIYLQTDTSKGEDPDAIGRLEYLILNLSDI